MPPIISFVVLLQRARKMMSLSRPLLLGGGRIATSLLQVRLQNRYSSTIAGSTSVTNTVQNILPRVKYPKADIRHTCNSSEDALVKGKRVHAAFANTSRLLQMSSHTDIDLVHEQAIGTGKKELDQQIKEFILNKGRLFEEIVLVEGSVASKHLGIHGRVDLLVKLRSGQHCLIDVKVTKFPIEMPNRYYWQLEDIATEQYCRSMIPRTLPARHCLAMAAYKICIKETLGISVDQLMLVRFHEGIPNYEVALIPNWSKVVKHSIKQKQFI